jgi:hypothetical protein
MYLKAIGHEGVKLYSLGLGYDPVGCGCEYGKEHSANIKQVEFVD